MFYAKWKSTGQTVAAGSTSKRNAPFLCLECGHEVVLRAGKKRVGHFAHLDALACHDWESESEAHRRCKMEIYEALRKEHSVQNVALERSLGSVRPDVSAYVKGVPVAIEIQMSSLSLETITHRTLEYFRKGIYVLWLLQWTPKLDQSRYSPTRWEKWIHATYFGQVYYWVNGLSIVCYRFDPTFKRVSKKMMRKGFSRRYRRFRRASRGELLNLVKDFVPRVRKRWQGRGIQVPEAALFIHRSSGTTQRAQGAPVLKGLAMVPGNQQVSPKYPPVVP
jgi:competence protein CoiA